MDDLGNAGRARKGIVLAWRRRRVSLAILGVIICVAMANGDLKIGAGGEARVSALAVYQVHETPVYALAFADSTRLASSTTAGEVRVTELATGEVWRLENPGGYPRCLAMSPGGRVLALGENGSCVPIWDVEAGIELEPLRDGIRAVRSAAFSPDGTKLAVGSWISDGQPERAIVTLWEWPTRRRQAELGPVENNINALAFSPDGGRMAVADSSGRVRLWDVGAGEELARWKAHESGIFGLAFSPDGRQFATACYAQGVVRLWDAIGGGPRGSLKVACGGISLAFSPDGTLIAMGRGDGIASLSDVASGRQVGAVRIPSG
jgi:WD40 repeat protein